MAYFDPRPKTRIEDFFDMRSELEEFRRSIAATPLTLVLGLRRYGKTSLVLTGLNMAGVSYLFIDARLLPSTGPVRAEELALLLSASLEDLVRREGGLGRRIASALRRVEGVSVAGVKIAIRPSSVKPLTLARVLGELEAALEGELVLVFDEAQELRRVARFRLDSLLAYVYDHLSTVKTVLTGSQVGLLYRFLRLDDPEAPLYGRPRAEVRLHPLSREEAIEFLRKGFEQYGVEPPGELLEEAWKRFGGVIGWLTYLGHRIVGAGVERWREVIGQVQREASRMALRELENFLSTRPLGSRRRYMAVLRAAAVLGEARWSNLKVYVESSTGRIPDKALGNVLRNLVDAGFLAREGGRYRVADLVLREALRGA